MKNEIKVTIQEIRENQNLVLAMDKKLLKDKTKTHKLIVEQWDPNNGVSTKVLNAVREWQALTGRKNLPKSIREKIGLGGISDEAMKLAKFLLTDHGPRIHKEAVLDNEDCTSVLWESQYYNIKTYCSRNNISMSTGEQKTVEEKEDVGSGGNNDDAGKQSLNTSPMTADEIVAMFLNQTNATDIKTKVEALKIIQERLANKSEYDALAI
tara:strand:- start:539 stop:1168 length:630 start_codon:yes stop_codon:yes gene_type:complete